MDTIQIVRDIAELQSEIDLYQDEDYATTDHLVGAKAAMINALYEKTYGTLFGYREEVDGTFSLVTTHNYDGEEYIEL